MCWDELLNRYGDTWAHAGQNKSLPPDLTAQGTKVGAGQNWPWRYFGDLWWDCLSQVYAGLPGISWTGSPPGSAHPVKLPCPAIPRCCSGQSNEDMTAPFTYGVILKLPSSSLPRTSVCQMKKTPTPVPVMRTRSVATGQTKATTCSPWWATLWAWATSGGFLISPTRTAEVPVLNGRVGWAHLALSRTEEGQPWGWAHFIKAGCEHHPWKWDSACWREWEDK